MAENQDFEKDFVRLKNVSKIYRMGEVEIRAVDKIEFALKVGGVLVSDNVLQDGDIIESHYAVERRNRTIYKRMREYLYELKHDERLMSSIVPIGDGATLSVKIKE